MLNRKRKYIWLLLLSFSVLTLAEDNPKNEDLRKVENNAFKEGEKLVYNIDYGFITAGVATMEIPRIKREIGI